MTRLPLLEAELRHAARRRDSRRAKARALALGGLLTLSLGGVATAASSLIHVGDPAPPAPVPKQQHASTNSVRLLGLRTADPDGGPPWGMQVYRANDGAQCVQFGRVVDGQLGLLEDRDVLRPLPALGGPCQSGTSLAGLSGVQRLVASGHLQPATCTLAGQGPSRPAGLPPCQPSDVRTLVFGFAGEQAHSAELALESDTLRQPLSPAEQGAYLFVVRGPRAVGPEGEPAGVAVR